MFVIDAYTVRIFQRIGLLSEDVTYHEVQDTFMDSLSHDSKMFNEFHALIVRLGKEFCRPRPRCEGCPLKGEICGYQ